MLHIVLIAAELGAVFIAAAITVLAIVGTMVILDRGARQFVRDVKASRSRPARG